MLDKLVVNSEDNILQRLINSVVGVIIGIILFFLSFVVLWWNEGNVIAQKGALDEMKRAMVKVSAEEAGAKTNGKLVYTHATLKSGEKLGDAPYVKPGGYLAMERVVEMYQWIEKEERESSRNLGGGRSTRTTYSYSMGWAPGRVESERFQMGGHTNPPLSIDPKKRVVAKSSFGKYDGAGVLEQLPVSQSLSVTKDMLAPTKDKSQTLNKGLIYIKKNPANAADAIGDVRISYRVVKQGDYTVMARQFPGLKLGKYRAKNGKENFLVAEGQKSAAQMITTEKENASDMAMIFRVVGFLMMWIGLNLLTGPIVTLLDVIPFLGTAGRFVLGLVWAAVAFVLSAVTIVVSMIAHHPVVLTLFLLAGAGGAYYYIKVYKPQKAAQGGRRGGGGSASGQSGVADAA
jgi:hypothetical protein